MEGRTRTTLTLGSTNNQINPPGVAELTTLQLAGDHQSPAELDQTQEMCPDWAGLAGLWQRVCWPQSLPLSSYKMSQLTSQPETNRFHIRYVARDVTGQSLVKTKLHTQWGERRECVYRDVRARVNWPQFVVDCLVLQQLSGWSHLHCLQSINFIQQLEGWLTDCWLQWRSLSSNTY